VQLPEAARATEHEGERIEVLLESNGTVTVGQEVFGSAEAFGDYLAVRSAGGPGATVLIQADRGVAYNQVARLLAACRKAGTAEVALAARRPVGS